MKIEKKTTENITTKFIPKSTLLGNHPTEYNDPKQIILDDTGVPYDRYDLE